MRGKTQLIAAGLGALLLAAGIAGQVLPGPPDASDKQPLGLFSSLPIYWSESDDIGGAIDGGGDSTHWVRTELESANRLVPLDTLDGDELKALKRLVLAQPRPLAPAENVALDDWVRAGGRALLFADPMLTEHSRFALGDRRRPQDIAVLSPILKRWGLELRFDEDQPEGRRVIADGSIEIPVDLSGTLVAVTPGAPSRCSVGDSGVTATCRVGKGSVTVVADAEVLDREGGEEGDLRAIRTLISRSIG